MTTINTTSKIRKALAEALDKAVRGDLSAEEGRAIIGLANQISQSMAVEVKVATMKLRTNQHVDKFGDLAVD